MDTSSTHLELQTLLWALETVPSAHPLTVFTDCQNIIDLPARRKRLEAQQFCSKQGRPLNNGELYRAIFALLDRRSYELVKLKGHSRTREKAQIDRVFALVDQAARQGCREGKL